MVMIILQKFQFVFKNLSDIDHFHNLCYSKKDILVNSL